MPKISVIVPIYNVEKYLRECLESILNQTFSDFEIICVNDGSTDSSSEILDEYSQKDARVKVLNKENSGYGDSMNKGLEKATGKYIAIVESDDFIKNTMFEDLLNLAEKHDADVVKSDYFYYLTAKKQLRKAGKILKNCVINIKDYTKLLKIPPSIWSAIYKREFLNKNNIRFLPTAGASYQDTSFAFKTLSLAETLVLTKKAYLHYRIDNENSSVHSKSKVFAICEEYNEITQFLENNPKVKDFANTIKLIKEYNAYMWNLNRIDEEFLDAFIEVFSATFKKYHDNNEIKKGFYNKISGKELNLLIHDKEKFRTHIINLRNKNLKKEKRRKLVSIRANSSRVSIVLFGKQIVEIGKE
ncbi:MAG: glycosyltransferase [Cyanobacteria bacterium SIG28]|nr:glycosyltransferase [Cyanobacteria bacterium SIG28]